MQKNISANLKYARPDRKLVEAFRGIPVANVDDCMDRTAAIDGSIRPLNKAELLGTAFTVRVPAGEILCSTKPWIWRSREM